MSRIPDELIEQVRDAADLVGIIGESVELKRTGTDYRGPCPFHGGTHRNFAVVPRKGMYYCYVCHAAGDVFTYLMKRYGMDYPTAVRQVAARVGITIPEQTERAGPDPREPLFAAVAAAQDWFHRQLRESPTAEPARNYLLGREIPLETAGELGLGWAPGGALFLDEMKKLGLAPAVLREAGLTAEREDGRVVPRFRNRITIPIHDLRGRVVAFGGRLIGPGEPKYLNSPESPVFHKGSQLYNLHAAKQAIRRDERALLVEGYFDTLRLVLAGIEGVVAPLGTSLTGEQAQLLTRFTRHVVICYDSDAPGQKAAFRAADECLRAGLRVSVASIPEGKDPDDLVRAQGAAGMQQVVDDALDVLELKLTLLERRGMLSGIEERRAALDRLLPTVRATKDPIQREIYLSTIAERTGVGKEVLAAELERERTLRQAAPPPAAPPEARVQPSAGPSRAASRASGDERSLLFALLASPDWVARARADGVTPDWFDRAEHREIFAALLGSGPGRVLPDGLSHEGELAWSELKESVASFDPERMGDTYEAAREALEARPHFRELDKLMRAIERAPAGAKDDLIKERDRRRAQLSKKYPAAWKRWYARRRGAGSQGRRATE
ncbi:MAG TPA: DNA primase [Gemmatimonadales bacterium]|nr:DNA primase [Gemmatimonadales bacterium]